MLVACLDLFTLTLFGVGRYSVVGIVTRYGLDVQGIESRWGRDFPHASRPALRPTQPHVQLGGKAARTWH
jgi:hypothetical protein